MDWARAKTVILVLLLFLNIFLFLNIINAKLTFESSKEYRVNAEKALSESGLVINCSIPSNNKPVERISFVEKDKNLYVGMIRSLVGVSEQDAVKVQKSYYKNDGKTLEFVDNNFIFTDNTQNTTVPVGNRKKLDSTLKTWIRKNKISNESFILDRIYEKDDTIIAEYVQLYKKWPIFNNKIIFTIKKNALVKVEGNLRIFYDLRANKEDKAVSAEIVLLTNKDKIKGAVESIELGYFLAQNDELYDTPVWRVKLSSGDVVLFNAFTGEWMDFS